MTESNLNNLNNKGENIYITRSENKYDFSTPQAADKNFNNNAKENSNNSDNYGDEKEIPQPLAMDSDFSPCGDDCICVNYLAMPSGNSRNEDRQEISQNSTHYDMYRHLGCTNNATYGIESSSSGSELASGTTAANVELELELLSLVAEFSQDGNATKAACCPKCCHGTCSRNVGFWISGEDLASNNPKHGCVKHRRKEDEEFRSTDRKLLLDSKDQKRRHIESCSNVMITQGTTAGCVSGSPEFSGVHVDAAFKKGPLFAVENVNKSFHFTIQSATQPDTAHLVKQKSCHEEYRDFKDNYIPAKYWERQKLASVWADQDIPLCPTTENYWETAARDPVINPFQVHSYVNDVCLEQSCNNTSGCNNATCRNSVHVLNTSSFNQFQQAGNYVNHTKSGAETVASVCNANMAANCSEVHTYVDRIWKSPEKKINQKLTSLNALVNTRLASSEKVLDSEGQSEFNVREKGMLDRKQTQVLRLNAKEQPNQHAESIHLSSNQLKSNNNTYDHLLDTSKYNRFNETEEMKSQPCLSFSKKFPTGKFNEIIKNTNGMLAILPKHVKRKYNCKRSRICDRIRTPEDRSPVVTEDLKNSSLSQIKYTDSRNAFLSYPLNKCLDITDNKNMQQTEMSYPLWYSRMQSIMNETKNPPQYIHDQSKGNKYQRLKHSRNCRRRRGIDGTMCCNMCLPEMPLGAQGSFSRDNTTGKRNAPENHKNSKRSYLKHARNRSKTTRLSRSRRRTTSTKLRHNGRKVKYAGRRRQNPRSTSMRARRRSRRSAYPSLRHHNYRRRSTGVRHHIPKSSHARQVSSGRRSEHKSRRRTKHARYN